MLDDFEAKRDATRLRRRPQILEALSRLPRAMERFREVHTSYARDVSTPVMTASLETSALLWTLCEATRPAQIVELGSGFSTFVLSSWVAGNTCQLLSIDDDATWQERSRSYIVDRGLAAPQMAGIEAIRDLPAADLLFLDYGLPPERIGVLRAVTSALRPSGVLVIDDVNQTPFGEQVRIARRPYGFRLYSVRAWTLDDFGRFAALAFRR